jgi:hypothetical protein
MRAGRPRSQGMGTAGAVIRRPYYAKVTKGRPEGDFHINRQSLFFSGETPELLSQACNLTQFFNHNFAVNYSVKK